MTHEYTLETLDDNAIRTALSAGLIDQDTADMVRGTGWWRPSDSARQQVRKYIVDALNAAVPAGAVRPSLTSQPEIGERCGPPPDVLAALAEQYAPAPRVTDEQIHDLRVRLWMQYADACAALGTSTHADGALPERDPDRISAARARCAALIARAERGGV